MALIERETPADGVTILRLNRREKHNALSLEFRRELAMHIDNESDRSDVMAIIIAGNEQTFAAGADLGEIIDLTPGHSRFDDLRVAWNSIARCRKPIIAAVRGMALGGGFELVLQCDLIIAGTKARFGLPEAKVGIVPGAGGMQRLSRLVGRHEAMLWLVTGQIMDASTAKELGIVRELTPDDLVETRALDLAKMICALPPEVTDVIKRALRLSENSHLDAAIQTERSWFENLFGTEFQHKSMSAFLSRRSGQQKAAS